MTLSVPLTLRVRTDRTDRDLTSLLRNLQIRSAIPGGFASIEAQFDHPLVFRPDEAAYYASMYVYDGRTGGLVIEGRLEDPERHAGPSGEIWGLTAIGPSAHASDRTVPLIYADRRVDSNVWQRADMAAGQAKGDSTIGDSSTSDTGSMLRLAWDSGQTVAVGDRVTVQYLPCRQTGQWIARLGCDHLEGAASSTLKVQAVGRVGGFGGADATLESDDWTTGTTAILQRYGNEHSVKYTAVELRVTLTGGASATSGSNYWTNLTNVHVIGSRYNADGTEKTSGYTTTTVLASDVVTDLLGRLLNKFDGTNATIAASSFGIEQLAYPDGVTAAEVFADLMTLEPNTWWAAWGSNDAGQYQFEWSTWPTTVDYEASTVDGFDSPGSAVDMYNSVTVRYKGAHGAFRHAIRTQTVPELTAAGLTRTAFIDLGDEGGGATNANQVGDLFLAEHLYPPNKGTLTVSRPILSRSQGRMVAPWEIRPGRLIRVQDVEPTVDALNATARDGQTIFRVVAVEYDADSNTARLELDSSFRTTARLLADIQANPALLRRRR